MTDEVTATLEPLDLDSLDTVAGSDKGAEVELKHPTTGKPLGIYVGIYGKHSHVFQEIVRDRTNSRIRDDVAARKRNEENNNIVTAEQAEARAIELIVACCFSWRTETKNVKGEVVRNDPTLRYKGQDLPFTVYNIKTVLENMIWVREQIDREIGNLANFIPA